MLTKEEKASLEIEIVGAKTHLKEIWQVLNQLEKISKSYLKAYDLWNKKFERADRKLAEEERLTKCSSPGRRQVIFAIGGLTRAQILAIAEELDEGDD